MYSGYCLTGTASVDLLSFKLGLGKIDPLSIILRRDCTSVSLERIIHVFSVFIYTKQNKIISLPVNFSLHWASSSHFLPSTNLCCGQPRPLYSIFRHLGPINSLPEGNARCSLGSPPILCTESCTASQSVVEGGRAGGCIGV